MQCFDFTDKAEGCSYKQCIESRISSYTVASLVNLFSAWTEPGISQLQKVSEQQSQ